MHIFKQAWDDCEGCYASLVRLVGRWCCCRRAERGVVSLCCSLSLSHTHTLWRRRLLLLLLLPPYSAESRVLAGYPNLVGALAVVR